ncbi:MAG: NUDIX domain-containing protein [Gemmatimonadetes bacterium]|nr:NUDIX domain-containing protein [Gemmatimonadota bacterium]NNM04933.1 NUDIX domain-containing protein [Gemmatimonadota bacterium]
MIELVIPFQRLPDGFLRFIDDPPDPPPDPRPSATLVLLRNGEEGLEVLLMKRSPRAGFIPGAWVFPGGTLDPADEDSHLISRLSGISSHRAAEPLRSAASDPPGPAFWIAALRETFEETGILLWTLPDPAPRVPEPSLDAIVSARKSLLSGDRGFDQVLDDLGVLLDAGALEYCGHWLTPECEPRRYETRFFAAEVDPDVRVDPHEMEMVDALWVSPTEALDRNRDGDFPLVIPTMVTLDHLRAFDTTRGALGALKEASVPRLLPMPERVAGGIRFRISRS